MQTPRFALILVSVTLTAVRPAAAQSPSLTARIDAYLAPFAEQDYLSGNVLVARGDSVLYERSFGLANREFGVPFTSATLSNVASITKPMTVVIAARLIDEGKLRLGQTLAEFLPGFPRGDAITVEHLLRHRAGIPHRLTTPEEETVPRTAADMVELARDTDLLFEPGERSVYSSGGYSVLARVLEIAGGMPYEDLLEHYLTGPAGMSHTAHVSARDIVARRAACYAWGLHGLENAPLQDLSFLVGAGSVYSTARDLFVMMRALTAGRLGETARAALMRETGLAWNGSTSGFRAFADWSAETDVAVVLTANVQSGANDLIRRNLPRIVAGEDVAAPAPPTMTAARVSERILRGYEGTYQLREGSPMDVRVARGGLYVDQWFLIPTSDTTFFSPQDFGTVTVIRDAQGTVTHFDWAYVGGSLPMTRIGPRKAAGQ